MFFIWLRCCGLIENRKMGVNGLTHYWFIFEGRLNFGNFVRSEEVFKWRGEIPNKKTFLMHFLFCKSTIKSWKTCSSTPFYTLTIILLTINYLFTHPPSTADHLQEPGMQQPQQVPPRHHQVEVRWLSKGPHTGDPSWIAQGYHPSEVRGWKVWWGCIFTYFLWWGFRYGGGDKDYGWG